MPFWIIQYVYMDANGEAGVSHTRIEASDKEAASKYANDAAPATEFMFTVHAESDEQFLGSTRQQALRLSGHESFESDLEED